MRRLRGCAYSLPIVLIVVFALALAFGLPPKAIAAQPMKFVLISGSPGGGWYTQSGVISQVIKKALPSGSSITIVPGSSISNLVGIDRGAAQMGYTMTCWAGWAKTGSGPLRGRPAKNVRAIATIDQNFVNIVARHDLPINSLHEVKSKKYPLKIAMQRPTTDTGGVIIRYVLSEYGWGPPKSPFFSELKKWGGSLRVVSSHGEAVGLLRDGHIDMWVAASSFNHPPVVELTTARKVKFMPVDKDIQKIMKEKYNLPTFVVPAGTFKYMDNPTPFIGVMTVLIASVKQPEGLIYKITKSLAEGKKEMCKAIKRLCQYDPKKSWKNAGYEIHPGAARYYKEMGYMK